MAAASAKGSLDTLSCTNSPSLDTSREGQAIPPPMPAIEWALLQAGVTRSGLGSQRSLHQCPRSQLATRMAGTRIVSRVA
jgi:hypothetical protein